MQTILVCDDDKQIVEAIDIYLTGEGYQVVKAYDGYEVLEYLENNEADLLIIDVMMPGLDGFAVCRALRRRSAVPILFLTALSDEEDTLLGYELGADDYITKPFSLSLLYAKATALIRRDRGGVLTGDTLRCGDLEVSLSSRRVRAGGRELSLTPKEYALLTCLMRNRNMVMSREQLLVKCWGYDYEGEARAVDTHIRRLREKLGPYGTCIKTVIKAGYKLEG